MSKYTPKFDVMARYLGPKERENVAMAKNGDRGEGCVAHDLAFCVERLCNELARFDLALQSLTPGGSEFVNDPEACVAFVESAYRGRVKVKAGKI